MTVLPAPHAALAHAQAVRFAQAADSPNTRRAYAGDWQDFTCWCQGAGLATLPAAPETVAAYLAQLSGSHAFATLRRRLATIARAHREAKLPDFWAGHPAIRGTLRGIAREHSRPKHQAAAIGIREIRKLVATCGADAPGLRDRALLLIGYAGALRRVELVGIDRERVGFDATGIRLTLPRSKGDQEGAGALVDVPGGTNSDTCPVRALGALARRVRLQIRGGLPSGRPLGRH